MLQHEDEIDAAVVEARARARAAGLGYIKRAWNASREAIFGVLMVDCLHNDCLDRVHSSIFSFQAAAEADAAQPQVQTAPPPTLNDPVSGPASHAWSYANSLVRAYGPAALAAGSALLHPMQGRATMPVPPPTVPEASNIPMATLNQPQGFSIPFVSATGRSVSSSKAELRQRKLALERELAELDAVSSSSSTSPNRSPQLRSDAPLGSEGGMAHSYVGGVSFEEISREDAPAGTIPYLPSRRWLWGTPPVSHPKKD